MSRHLYDLEKLMDTEYGKEALTTGLFMTPSLSIARLIMP